MWVPSKAPFIPSAMRRKPLAVMNALPSGDNGGDGGTGSYTRSNGVNRVDESIISIRFLCWLRCSVPEVRCLCTLPLTLEENRRAVSDARADPVVGRRLHDQGRG